jgi:hypothetical protein
MKKLLGTLLVLTTPLFAYAEGIAKELFTLIKEQQDGRERAA